MSEDKNQFVILIVLIIIGTILLTFLVKRFNTPPKYSIDSLRKSSCEELHLTYSQCIKESSIFYWEYCNTLILPTYYDKCN